MSDLIATIDFKQFIKNIALTNGYRFFYGADPYLNLAKPTDLNADFYMIVTPFTVKPLFNNNTGDILTYQFNGDFSIFKHDKVDGDYEGDKYDGIILDCMVEVERVIKLYFGNCSHFWKIINCQFVETINALTGNFTGCTVKLTIEYIR